jgi:predicted RNase H-like nuclease (RuvC/YqgF family)
MHSSRLILTGNRLEDLIRKVEEEEEEEEEKGRVCRICRP